MHHLQILGKRRDVRRRVDSQYNRHLVARNDVEAAPPVQPQRVAEPRPGLEAHEAAILETKSFIITNDEAHRIGGAAQRHLALDGPGGEPVGQLEFDYLALRDDVALVLVEVQRDELPARFEPRRGRRLLINPADLVRQRPLSS